MGRPRMEIDRDQFEKLCYLQCTLTEIAGFFRCSEDTIERWCKREMRMSFADAFKTYSIGGKISLRRWQFKMAEHNVTMAIWLGKQYLGQREPQQEIQLSHDDETIREMNEYFNQKTSLRTNME